MKMGFESMGLKTNFSKINVMVSGGIAKKGLSKSKVKPCVVYNLRKKANSVLCVQCGKWIRSKCADMKMMTQKF